MPSLHAPIRRQARSRADSALLLYDLHESPQSRARPHPRPRHLRRHHHKAMRGLPPPVHPVSLPHPQAALLLEGLRHQRKITGGFRTGKPQLERGDLRRAVHLGLPHQDQQTGHCPRPSLPQPYMQGCRSKTCRAPYRLRQAELQPPQPHHALLCLQLPSQLPPPAMAGDLHQDHVPGGAPWQQQSAPTRARTRARF